MNGDGWLKRENDRACRRLSRVPEYARLTLVRQPYSPARAECVCEEPCRYCKCEQP